MSTDAIPGLEAACSALEKRNGARIVWLTGAGISAESGIPTFRGKEGYWVVGSKDYHPQEMATQAAFREMPDEVWAWYLYRRAICRAAEPNPAHLALAQCEENAASRFRLITQNVDGLHLRAGNTQPRTFEIHGNIDYMRCARGCCLDLFPMPDGLVPWPKEQKLNTSARQKLVCPRCAGPSRPHVLWFDESYDEPRFKYESSLLAARDCDVLIVVGTTPTTTLPVRVAELALKHHATYVVVNPDSGGFEEQAKGLERGYFVQGPAGASVPALVAALS